MRRADLVFSLFVALGLVAGSGSVLRAGDRCPSCGTEKPKKFFKLPDHAPEAGIAFAVPGVVSNGQAVRVPESAVRDAMKKAVAESAKSEAGAVSNTKSCEDRLNAIEQDVRDLKTVMEKLTVAVTELARQQATARPK